MTNYEKLVEALRCGEYKPECGSSDCPYWSGLGCMDGQLMEDAADAIEKLVTLYEKAEMDATNLTGKLAQAEAEVERLKDSNEELRERQIYIDHYGSKWMTSAKDVPTAAYEHGYADGRDEAEAQLPKRGEWNLTNDEIETIRIHMNAIKEQLCNQYRHREAETYQTIVDKLAKMEVQDGQE